MRALPAGCARIQRTESAPYRIAMMPAPIARKRALSRVIFVVSIVMLLKNMSFIVSAGSYHKGLLQALRDAHPLERHVGRKPLPVRRVVLAPDERQQVAPAGRGDSEPVLGDEIA